MHGSERHVIYQLPSVLGVDLSITNEVVLLWVSALATMLLLVPACRRRNAVASGPYQNFFEGLIEFIDKEVVKGGIGKEGFRWAPFLLALFFFILFGNLVGLVPIPVYVKPATSNFNVTAALAAMVFLLTVGIGVRRHGVGGFAGKFFPEGVPLWAAVVVVPIEIVSWLAKPLSLAIRLFANMATGHLLIFIFVGLTSAAAVYLKPLPLAGAVIMSLFELFVCFIQAFIFTMLAGIYISEALQTAH